MTISTANSSTPTTDSLTMARAAFLRGDLGAILDLARGSTHLDVERVWSLAWSALFGPVGLHEAYRGPDGLPTAQARALPMCRWFPETVGQFMDRARAELAVALGLHAQTVEAATLLPNHWRRVDRDNGGALCGGDGPLGRARQAAALGQPGVSSPG